MLMLEPGWERSPSRSTNGSGRRSARRFQPR
jgi:hypothetical protein